MSDGDKPITNPLTLCVFHAMLEQLTQSVEAGNGAPNRYQIHFPNFHDSITQAEIDEEMARLKSCGWRLYYWKVFADDELYIMLSNFPPREKVRPITLEPVVQQAVPPVLTDPPVPPVLKVPEKKKSRLVQFLESVGVVVVIVVVLQILKKLLE